MNGTFDGCEMALGAEAEQCSLKASARHSFVLSDVQANGEVLMRLLEGMKTLLQRDHLRFEGE
jgi:hypothetical protein